MNAAVVINGRAAVRREIGGVERVARELCDRLPRLRPGCYRVVSPPPALAHRAGHAWEQAALPLLAREAELILSPANLAPVASRRNVVIVHDVAPFRSPEWYGRAYTAYHRASARLLARRARHLITVSEFSRGELVSLLGVAPERVSVASPGVDARFSPEADPGPARARHGLERPYALALGTDIARKNLGVLEQAGRRLAEAGIELVLAGGERDYMRGGSGSSLRRLGYVSEEDLPGLYAGARALAMPSLYEGFGLPCLEAMASGVPVVAADRAALPETCAGAALLVDPHDAAGVADALVAAATDDGVRERLIAAGTERAALFTWEDTAGAVDRALSRLLTR